LRIVGYRLDDARAKKLDAVFAYYKFTDDRATANHIALLDMIFDLTENRINSQTVAEKQSDHQNHKVNTACNLRVSRKEIVRVLDKNADLAYEEQTVCYCVQWDKGKVRRQLKLVTDGVCEICSLLNEEYLKRQAEAEAELEKPYAAPPAIQQRQTITQPPTMPTKQAPPTKREPINTWRCPRRADGSEVHYTSCFDCKADRRAVYVACIMEHTDIGINLAYWQRKHEQEKAQAVKPNSL